MGGERVIKGIKREGRGGRVESGKVMGDLCASWEVKDNVFGGCGVWREGLVREGVTFFFVCFLLFFFFFCLSL